MLHKFVTIITEHSPSFDNLFISLAKNYIANNIDDDYSFILTNSINMIENTDNKS